MMKHRPDLLTPDSRAVSNGAPDRDARSLSQKILADLKNGGQVYIYTGPGNLVRSLWSPNVQALVNRQRNLDAQSGYAALVEDLAAKALLAQAEGGACTIDRSPSVPRFIPQHSGAVVCVAKS